MKLRLLWSLWVPLGLAGAGPVLIVADEIPAMEVLAAKLKAGAAAESRIVRQEGMPGKLDSYPVVIVYIHGRIGEPAERAFIDYAEGGGRLILVHHSISSGKRPNKFWFPFLRISLPEKPFEEGGYRWIEGVPLEVVNLAPQEFITTRDVTWPQRVSYKRSDVDESEQLRPAFHLEESEVYLNQVFHGPRTILLGFKYQDAKTGATYMQDRAGWYMPAGRGMVMYFMPGHSVYEFENPVYAQILVNAVTFKP